MIDIEILEKCIQEFAKTYDFIQQIDINIMEQSDSFDRQDYRKIDGKKIVCINKYLDQIIIEFGTIKIEIDEIEEQEWYWIDKNRVFSINTMDISDKDMLMEEMIRECKKNKFIDILV
jgi:hypothetical protein